MDKEKILETVKDLVLTLNSSNFKDPDIQERWKKKQELVNEALTGLTNADIKWLDKEYDTWSDRVVVPLIKKTQTIEGGD